MGIYNCAQTLPEALDSLLAQTYQQFKVIMCDDGSSDNTFEIAQGYVARYPEKIKLIRNERNMGLNYTLNHCLKYADTEYVARMDGDDISLPERFEKEIAFLDKHKDMDIVSTPMIFFDETGTTRVGKAGGKYVEKEDFIKGPPFCHAPCMVRREAYEAVGGYTVDRRLLRVEDYHLWFKMYAKGYRGYILPEPLYKMRDDSRAIGRRKLKYRWNSMCLRLKWYPKIGLPWWTFVYAFRPVIIGLMPTPIYKYFHLKKRNTVVSNASDAKNNA